MLFLLDPTRSPRKEYIVSSGGLQFIVDPRSYIEWNILYFGDYEGSEIALFRDLIRRHKSEKIDVILDIGANIGNHSLRFSQFSRNVISYEPNPHIYERLVANIKVNNIDNIKTFRFGLGLVDGVIPFFAPNEEANGGNMGTGTFVPTEAPDGATQLDLHIFNGDALLTAELPGRIDAIKIDVQGFETEVMRGLAQTIENNRPIIWFEVSGSTADAIEKLGGVRNLIPFEHDLYRFNHHVRLGIIHALSLEPGRNTTRIEEGDYVVVPRCAAGVS